MPNIVLTNKCNLNCSYCFAKELTNQKEQSFSVENFVKAVNFIKSDNNPKIGIVGGEPTIHSDFSKFIEILNNDNEIRNCVIYTNGIELYKYIGILQPAKFGLLINCNSPSDIGYLYNKLENSLKLLSKSNKKEFSLGINIYSNTMDYSYIFNLLKIVNQHQLRFSISISNKEKQNSNDILDLLEQYNPIILNFYNDCIKNEIVPYLDCAGIPICIMNDELKKAQLKIGELQKKYKFYHNILGTPCSLQVDILPDLTAIRSICYPNYKEKFLISDFKSVSSLTKFFYNSIDVYHNLLFISEKCNECKYRLFGLCNVCLGFTINKFQEFKDYVLNSPHKNIR